MRILLAYDGSGNAKVALARAIELTKNSGDAELLVVVAASVPIPAPYANRSYYEQLHADMLDQAKTLLTEALDLAKQAGLARVTGSVKKGSPPEVIVSLASEIGADMIVVGRRGIGGVERMLMGSVSSSVLARAKCDVLVVIG